jgi:hypothetical protein
MIKQPESFMRRLSVVFTLFALLCLSAPAYAATTCYGAPPTAAADVIVCSGTFPRTSLIDLGGGDDQFSNYGAVSVVRGGAGADIIINYGESGGLAGGDQNDVIINNGNASGSIDGDGGSDIIINNGNNFVSGQSFGIDGGSGNDTIVQNNRSSYTLGGGGDDTIILGANARGHNNIRGGGGTDTLCFNMPGASAVVDPTVLSGSVTINGQTFGYGEFEQIAFNCALPTITYPNLIRNGAFSGGLAQWSTWATPTQSAIVAQITGGALGFYRAVGASSAAVLQNTGAALPIGAPLRLTLSLGNSSAARKRVMLVIHDTDWSDLMPCSFWIPPNTPLRTYTMTARAGEGWSAATLSIYAATADGLPWLLVDNIALRHTPTLPVIATLCDDPGAP